MDMESSAVQANSKQFLEEKDGTVGCVYSIAVDFKQKIHNLHFGFPNARRCCSDNVAVTISSFVSVTTFESGTSINMEFLEGEACSFNMMRCIHFNIILRLPPPCLHRGFGFLHVIISFSKLV